jgi:hypothetical protein
VTVTLTGDNKRRREFGKLIGIFLEEAMEVKRS